MHTRGIKQDVSSSCGAVTSGLKFGVQVHTSIHPSMHACMHMHMHITCVHQYKHTYTLCDHYTLNDNMEASVQSVKLVYDI